MSEHFNSELEKTNLEVHVDMARQRYVILSEKVETLDERMDAALGEIGAFRKEYTETMADFRKEHADNMTKIREENATNTQGTHKLFVGAAATVIGTLLSTIVVLLIAFI